MQGQSQTLNRQQSSKHCQPLQLDRASPSTAALPHMQSSENSQILPLQTTRTASHRSSPHSTAAREMEKSRTPALTQPSTSLRRDSGCTKSAGTAGSRMVGGGEEWGWAHMEWAPSEAASAIRPTITLRTLLYRPHCTPAAPAPAIHQTHPGCCTAPPAAPGTWTAQRSSSPPCGSHMAAGAPGSSCLQDHAGSHGTDCFAGRLTPRCDEHATSRQGAAQLHCVCSTQRHHTRVTAAPASMSPSSLYSSQSTQYQPS